MGDAAEIWVRAILAGFLAWRDQDPTAAAAHWRGAAQVRAGTATGDSTGDPADLVLHAVACTNLVAAGHATAADMAALTAAWAGVRQAAMREAIPLPARSSVFHLRLASRHEQPFTDFLRRRYLILAGLGQWLGDANRLASTARPEALTAHLRSHDPAAGLLPDFLERAVQIALAGDMDRTAAQALLTTQIDHIRALRATAPLPVTLWKQLDACLGFCAFAPIAGGFNRPGGHIITGEPHR